MNRNGTEWHPGSWMKMFPSQSTSQLGGDWQNVGTAKKMANLASYLRVIFECCSIVGKRRLRNSQRSQLRLLFFSITTSKYNPNLSGVSEERDSDISHDIFLQPLTRIFHEHFVPCSITFEFFYDNCVLVFSWKFAKCSPKASRCSRTCFVATWASIGNYSLLRCSAHLQPPRLVKYTG